MSMPTASELDGEPTAVEAVAAWVRDYRAWDEDSNMPTNKLTPPCPRLPSIAVLAEAFGELELRGRDFDRARKELDEVKAANKRLADLGKVVEKERDDALKHADEVKADNERLEGELSDAKSENDLIVSTNCELVSTHNEALETIEQAVAERDRMEEELKAAKKSVGELQVANALQLERFQVQGKEVSELRKQRDVDQGELLQQRLTTARLMGYIEAHEDMKPPRLTQQVEHRNSIVDRVGPIAPRPHNAGWR